MGWGVSVNPAATKEERSAGHVRCLTPQGSRKLASGHRSHHGPLRPCLQDQRLQGRATSAFPAVALGSGVSGRFFQQCKRARRKRPI